MNAETANDMSKLNHAQQNAILSRYSWTTDGKVRVRSMHRSDPLLRMAGIADPVALEYYNLPVVRDGKGFLILDLVESSKRTPVSDSDESLFEAGGLFASDVQPGGKQPVDPNHEKMVFDSTGKVAGVAIYAVSLRSEKPAVDTTELGEFVATRTFEIPTGPHSKVRVMVIGYEDESLPSPGEPERWKPRNPTDTDVRAAVSALHMSRRLGDYEKI